jgi:hypothetical protein
MDLPEGPQLVLVSVFNSSIDSPGPSLNPRHRCQSPGVSERPSRAAYSQVPTVQVSEQLPLSAVNSAVATRRS